jgi:hypothetical protein
MGSFQNMMKRLKQGVRQMLRRTGYDIVRMSVHDQRVFSPGHDDRQQLPEGVGQELRPDHPRLAELRSRYARLDLPMASPTMWRPDYLRKELDLRYFRGDNVYVWQYRNVGRSAYHKYYFFLRDIASRDNLGLLDRLREDGLFGCWTFEYPGWPVVSRDLLDSINELYFLERHTQMLSTPGFTVLDVGAGYGRLAYRALSAAPQLGAYLCADAVPESTFLCEFYLRFRGCTSPAEVLPLDELDLRLAGRRVDLAVNIHSFSEMSAAAIDGWLERIARLQASWLLIVPNDADRLLTMEKDGSRKAFDSLLAARGFELAVKQPIFPDPTLREFMGVSDHFFLYRRTALRA